MGPDIDNGDGTEVDHKRDIDPPNKETKALLAIGWGLGTRLEWTINGKVLDKAQQDRAKMSVSMTAD